MFKEFAPARCCPISNSFHSHKFITVFACHALGKEQRTLSLAVRVSSKPRGDRLRSFNVRASSKILGSALRMLLAEFRSLQIEIHVHIFSPVSLVEWGISRTRTRDGHRYSQSSEQRTHQHGQMHVCERNGSPRRIERQLGSFIDRKSGRIVRQQFC